MRTTLPKLKRLDKPALPDRYGISNSPIGYLMAAWQGDLLTHLSILPAGAENDPMGLIADRHWPHGLVQDDAAAKVLVKTILFPANEWVGTFPNTLQIGFHGTDLQWSLMQHMLKIPAGKTASYGVLAAMAGSPRAARAAGTVCAKNPVALIVPCHRILAGNGLGGYGYGPALKRQLLAWENAL